jgi:hypothetical protein
MERRPREHDDRYLDFIRQQRCCLCGTEPAEPAHLRMGSINDDKPHTGMGEKSSDRWALPLCRRHHVMQHTMNESEFWASFGVDPVALAMHMHARPR